MDDTRVLETDCVIAGGGPAGLMLGVLLARGGARVVVLERHDDFLRDFRGDTIHPSTQNVLDEIGLLEAFRERPHADMPRVTMRFAGRTLTFADFSRLPGAAQTIAFMPQWEFLDFLAEQASQHAGFSLRRRTAADDLLWDGDRVAGVVAHDDDGRLEIRARLVVAADGRDSRLRAAAGLEPTALAAQFDALWFRLPRAEGATVPFFQGGDGTVISIDRGDFWQIARLVPRGTWTADEASLDALRVGVTRLEPSFADALAQLGVDDVHLLRVRIDRLERWHRDGLLAIGDAAHAMSPAGGVGINLAIQDAVAAANALLPGILDARPAEALLARIQRRRMLPTRITQGVQVAMQPAVFVEPSADGTATVPLPLRLLSGVPMLSHLMGRFVGLGARPEHVRHR